jgi:enediyne biosynthesis protein E4
MACFVQCQKVFAVFIFRSPLAVSVGVLIISMAALAQAADPAAPPVARFVEETDAAGLQSRFDGENEFMVGGGVAAFDCSGDGLPEVYVTAGVNKAKFYRNRSARGGPIKLQEERSGLELTNAIGAYPLDVDGDGNTDLVVLRVGEVQVFKGLGACKFERANAAWGVQSSNGWHSAFSATWMRGQSWPTLAIGTYLDRSKPEFPWGNCTAGMLLRPQADSKKFAPPVALAPGHCALSMLFSDWNRSGEAALRVSNDREYYKDGQEQLWSIKPTEAPTLYTPQQGWKPLQIWGMGIASHDITGDGLPEVFLTSMADNKFQQLEAGAAQPKYIDSAYKRGITAHRPYVGGDIHPSTAWHAQFADANNDGYADLFIVKGNVSTMPDFATLDPNNLLLQLPTGNFTEVGQQAGVASFRRGRGGMMVDLNADGLLDMLVVNRWDKAQLWRNVGAGTPDKPVAMGRWLQLRLVQGGGNRDAVGAWVEVDLGPAAGGRVIRQELTVGGGHASGHSGWMHFGLGAAEQVKLRVQWPQGGWSEWQPAAANNFYTMTKDTGLANWKAP